MNVVAVLVSPHGRQIPIFHATRPGYLGLTAADGREALEICAEGQGCIDLVLSDVLMPGMNGPELAVALEQRYPGTAVLLMTGYAVDAIEAWGPTLSTLDVIQKPFALDELLSRVARALDRVRAGGG